ncbi:glycosyltransferase [Actinospica durhamensis]|uniref:Glycosyltransferase n=1 Tax=Actinospica durhamensis TaxID=1508375 RepID=A0A941ELC4_9ACTN|nr:galactosyltransferase-related protein [Actinospica durhamensis]MBR7833020.1 glycosyltransferase [Actinospica durhamensis]
MVSQLTPSDRGVLAAAVADSLVVLSDPGASRSGLYYWGLAKPWNEAVAAALRAVDEPRVTKVGEALAGEPENASHYRELRSALEEAEADAPGLAALLEAGWQAQCNSRIGYHVGPRYDAAAGSRAVTADELRVVAPGEKLAADVPAEVLVVIPFRDRNTGGARLRNLLACLIGLRDQSFPRESYRVAVVECDDRPRWREVIEPYADTYLFAEKADRFNKSWTVNAGVVNSPGDAAVVCILDADVLPDRDFIARNAARFTRAGVGGHLPYRAMSCVDYASAEWAIRERVNGGAADPAHLRAFQLRRPPGLCNWVRTGVFHKVSGFDERYEGWGGEDNDFVYRLDPVAPIDVFDDWIMHLPHPPASELRADGELVNAHIPPLSWQPGQEIGRLDRFAAKG